jgi:hypothetical protein
MGQGNGTKISGRPAWFDAAVLLFSSWIAIAALSLQIRTDTEVVAVAFPPWWSTQQAFQAAASANAKIVRVTALPAVLVVRPDNQAGLSRLREAGVWLAVNPGAIAACLTFEGEGSRG